jgi:hypothetical protein
VIIRHLIVPLTVAALTLHAGQAFAQDASSTPPFGQDIASEVCMNGFAPLRLEAEARGKLIKAASARHAPPDEACKLIGSFRQSEIKMIKYIEADSATCGISPELADQLRAGHKNTEAMQKTVCAAARRAQGGGSAGPVGDFDDVDAGKL